MKKKIIILTSNDIRHKFFRIFLSNQKNIIVKKTYSEITIENKNFYREKSKKITDKHFFMRHLSELDFFELYIDSNIDNSNNIFCKKGFISSKKCLNQIKKNNPDIIIVYGSSIIKGSLINDFKNKIINVHLGLSPYYRGSGTNFYPILNSKPEYIGVTFMFLDKGIDTGKIIHQQRANINSNDNIHSIGNRLILDMAKTLSKLIKNFDKIKLSKFSPKSKPRYFYKKNDFHSSLIYKINDILNKNLLKKYLLNKNKRDKSVPIFKQKWIK